MAALHRRCLCGPGLFSLLTLLAACGAPPPPVSQRGMERCRLESAAVVPGSQRKQAEQRCLAEIDAVLAREDRQAAPAKSPRSQGKDPAVERCMANRPRASTLMADLGRAEQQLADIKAESFQPSERPQPPDEAMEARFSRDDQELDRQHYEAAVAGWERREASRRSDFTASRGQRLAQAQQRLNSTARQLRELEPALFTGPSSIEFEPEVARRLTSCDPSQLRTTSARRPS